ncbi:hypothetical protein [Thalassolituus sp. UBA2009]|jgi:hypothetical protein|uniref:hypothetical protein n=1 Tax=Thalassolituus sp. UBA2009 TaxID=1947658 RepID=UPI000C5C1A53|nr:hypothetical protein [Thalassolituus sp. UBA2009]MAY14269.1 hypothetical protein [Oceanospirillaceae bacterium]|tara:strand:+ start:403 stop:1026 length:624 start_codon:yes stop_codon:yes gene_type:complete
MDKSSQQPIENWKLLATIPFVTTVFYLTNYLLAKYYYSKVGIDFSLLSDSSGPLIFSFERTNLIAAEALLLIALIFFLMANYLSKKSGMLIPTSLGIFFAASACLTATRELPPTQSNYLNHDMYEIQLKNTYYKCAVILGKIGEALVFMPVTKNLERANIVSLSNISKIIANDQPRPQPAGYSFMTPELRLQIEHWKQMKSDYCTTE